MNGQYSITGLSTAYSGWVTLLVATIRTPGKQTIVREIEDHGSAVCVLPYSADRRTAVLVRQFRAPAFHTSGQQETLEAIAGILEEDDPAECARRETREEAGLELDSIEHLYTGWTMPGLSTERMHLFLATYSGPPALQGQAAAGESITPVEFALPELVQMLDQGKITDLKTLLLIQTLRLRRPTLFEARRSQSG